MLSDWLKSWRKICRDKVHLNKIWNGELSDPLCDSVIRDRILVWLGLSTIFHKLSIPGFSFGILWNLTTSSKSYNGSRLVPGKKKNCNRHIIKRRSFLCLCMLWCIHLSWSSNEAKLAAVNLGICSELLNI